MSWIRTIPRDEAEGPLAALYRRIAGADGHVDNILAAHSLRPHTLEGHMTLYKHVLHHVRNTVPSWVLELLGVYVSQLNGCTYCVEHHAAGLGRLLGDELRLRSLRAALEARDWTDVVDTKVAAALVYAGRLTEHPARVAEHDVAALREAGWTDGEVLEINQVVAYFAYANRTVLGLGVALDDGPLGLSPNDADDPENWAHR